MADYLLKTEPTEYSFADLQKDGATEWDGVSNPVALKNLREMKPGDRLIIYETGDQKSAVGMASVVAVQVSSPKNPVVKIKAGAALSRGVSWPQRFRTGESGPAESRQPCAANSLAAASSGLPRRARAY